MLALSRCSFRLLRAARVIGSGLCVMVEEAKDDMMMTDAFRISDGCHTPRLEELRHV